MLIRRVRTVLAVAAILFASTPLARVEANVILTDSKLTLADGVKQAQQTGMPLIVLGTNPGCHNCEGVKKAIDSSSELRLMLGQYVAVEMQITSAESKALVQKTMPKGSQGVGYSTPLVIIFTSKGDTAFASHVTPLKGLSVEVCKDVLIDGIKKNGGLKDPTKLATPNLASDVSKAQKFLKEDKVLAAATAISPYVTTGNKSSADELAELIKITKLEVAKSKTDEQLASLVTELTDKGGPVIDAVAGKIKTADPTVAAVQLAAAERAFGNYPKFAGKFDAPWKELLDKAKIPDLKEQAQLVDEARQLDQGSNSKKTIEAYELVSKTYPGSKAAELAQMRIKQLKGK